MISRLTITISFLLLCAVALAAQTNVDLMNQAQELLDEGNPDSALTLLGRVLDRDPKNADAYLMRSTAFFLLGQNDPGRRDLQKALSINPKLRQGWLNRAGLDLVEENYREALFALQKAEELDPTAVDNHINIGAVKLLLGDLQGANQSFLEYLKKNRKNAQAYYLIATNFAMAGYAGPALESLERAVKLDERIRLSVRQDANFQLLEDKEQFTKILETDTYVFPQGAYRAKQTFPLTYKKGDRDLLTATLDALRGLGISFDTRVEVASRWALVWGEIRIKVSRPALGDEGWVELSASPQTFTPAEWNTQAKNLLNAINARVQKRLLLQPKIHRMN